MVCTHLSQVLCCTSTITCVCAYAVVVYPTQPAKPQLGCTLLVFMSQGMYRRAANTRTSDLILLSHPTFHCLLSHPTFHCLRGLGGAKQAVRDHVCSKLQSTTSMEAAACQNHSCLMREQTGDRTPNLWFCNWIPLPC